MVGDRGIGEAVAHDDGTALERGTHHRLDVLRPVRRVQQRLGACAQAHGVDVEHDLAQLATDRRGPWLVSEDDLVTAAMQPLREEPRLGGLPDALPALEHDEHPGIARRVRR